MTLESIEGFVKSIRENIILQAENFLNEAGEFYPFGAVIDTKGDLKPVGIYFGEEHPDAGEVIDRLGVALYEGLERGDYKIVGMGIDIYLPGRGEKKRSAIEIRIMDINGLIAKFWLPYQLNQFNKVEFEELITVSE
ncbi:MAG TPA: hypothetical protein VGD35_19050 [Chitinophaga sp.]